MGKREVKAVEKLIELLTEAYADHADTAKFLSYDLASIRTEGGHCFDFARQWSSDGHYYVFWELSNDINEGVGSVGHCFTLAKLECCIRGKDSTEGDEGNYWLECTEDYLEKSVALKALKPKKKKK